MNSLLITVSHWFSLRAGVEFDLRLEINALHNVLLHAAVEVG
jgi:hypothetical protein